MLFFRGTVVAIAVSFILLFYASTAGDLTALIIITYGRREMNGNIAGRRECGAGSVAQGAERKYRACEQASIRAKKPIKKRETSSRRAFELASMRTREHTSKRKDRKATSKSKAGNAKAQRRKGVRLEQASNRAGEKTSKGRETTSMEKFRQKPEN